ncbi:ABC transporter substrate-binding protein [Coraliomargarita algicola]|uniref:histidine kinase n=1 Tax=Coraliomargarita algicola TaxID=3092156 RepID=A0ABZ0RNJ6_9BACT|nr:ABC transporter substrate-binding protein [Coraliomargarita sp. J2-16]WPJ96991.1 ABC transporter substrate-binding protein [Coraliomargarita sp. J2-16]
MKAISSISVIISLVLCTASLSHAQETVRLQLKWLHQFQFAGYYAAIEQGYYAAEGLKVELLEASTSKPPTQVVLDGEADFGISGADLLLLHAAGEQIKALAAIYQHSPSIFASIKHDDIQNIHDLANKRIVLEPGSADLLAMLKAEQLELSSIQFLEHQFTPEPLYRGEADAISAYITDEPFTIRQRGQQPVTFSPRSTGIDFYSDILFTTQDYLDKHPKTVAAFKRASLQGWRYALDHPQETIDLILEKYPTIKSRAALEYEAKRSVELIRPGIIEIGYMHLGRWKHIAETFQSVGMLDTIPDLEAMLYKDSLRFSERYPLKLIAIYLISILTLSLIAWKEWNGRRRLENEINRRKLSDKLLTERENAYQALYEGAPLAFIVWDNQLVISHWNQAAEQLFGWSAEEAIGQSAMDLIVPQSALPAINQGVEKLESNSPHTQINENVTKDGQPLWCRWHNVPRKNRDGVITEFHSIASDVTHEIERVTQLEMDCQNAHSENQAKDLLLARTSHEIRNPLNAIMGFTQLILSDSKDDDTKDMAQTILEGAEGMLRILNDLLDTAKIDAGKMNVNWAMIDLEAIIRRETKLFSQLIENQGLSCQVIIDCAVTKIQSDQRCIQQILSNLINNARKFTQEGGIEIRLSEKNARQLSIQVKDTGVGMNPQTLERVFEPFTQASDATNQHFGGTGLGLSLTKKLTELIGGHIYAESELGVGSTFTLLLPKQR